MAETNPCWIVEPFDKSRHKRQGFDCGVEALNDWLATKVSQFEKRDLARTFVLVEKGQAAIKGYYAFASHAIVYEALPEEQAQGLPVIDVPVILIGRLAVDRSVQGQGLGEFLLIDALRRAESVSRSIGVRGVEINAIDEKAKGFYQRYGFLMLTDDFCHLFLPISAIRRLKLPPM